MKSLLSLEVMTDGPILSRQFWAETVKTCQVALDIVTGLWKKILAGPGAVSELMDRAAAHNNCVFNKIVDFIIASLTKIV